MMSKPVALVLGSSSGIGFRIAQELVQSDYHVVITGKDESKLQNAAKSLNNSSYIVLNLRSTL